MQHHLVAMHCSTNFNKKGTYCTAICNMQHVRLDGLTVRMTNVAVRIHFMQLDVLDT